MLSTAFLIYSPSLANQFIWDDIHLVVNEDLIRDFNRLPDIFRTHLFHNTGGSNFYRPLQTLSFMVDYRIWGLNPFGYHLTNTLLHLLNVILIYFFVSAIFKNPDAGFLTSLVYAVHPVNTEAVTYISGRADPLGGLFFLAALLFYIKFRSRGGGLIPLFLSVLFFAFALLTKEATLVLPLVLIIYDALILKIRSVNFRHLAAYLPYFLIFAVYTILRLFILGLPLG
ncbi:MAG: glycosyltransferase family 39 protein, partial [Candidatus Omnitrophica bacterium]|nr:glycosyltransferase family 39 protein [Candidatus Omnitrophota bacterium]